MSRISLGFTLPFQQDSIWQTLPLEVYWSMAIFQGKWPRKNEQHSTPWQQITQVKNASKNCKKNPWGFYVFLFVLTKTQDAESLLNLMELINSEMARWGRRKPSFLGHRRLCPKGQGGCPLVLLCHRVPTAAAPGGCTRSASWEPPPSAQAQNSPPSCVIQLKYKIEHVVCALLNYLRKYYAGSYPTRQLRVETKQKFPLKTVRRIAASQPWLWCGKGCWWKQAKGKHFTIYWLGKQSLNDRSPAFLPCILNNLLL